MWWKWGQLFVYGNDIPQKRLDEVLDGVVGNSVNTVGVPKKNTLEKNLAQPTTKSSSVVSKNLFKKYDNVKRVIQFYIKIQNCFNHKFKNSKIYEKCRILLDYFLQK